MENQYLRIHTHALFIGTQSFNITLDINHDYVVKWKPFPRYWPFMGEIRSVPEQTVDYVYNRDAGDLRRHRAHYYSVTVMIKLCKRSILRMKQAFMSKQNGMNLQLRFFPAYMSVVCSALPCIIICYARRSHAPKSLRSVMAAQVKAGWMRIFQAWIVVTVS